MAMHQFDTEVAKIVGVGPATIYHSIWFWCERAKANDRNKHNGMHWVYNTHASWTELFPYFTKKQIRNALEKLINAGFIKKGEFNKDKRDRTLWYTALPITKSGVPKTPTEGAQKGSSSSVESYVTDNSIPPSAVRDANAGGVEDDRSDDDGPEPSLTPTQQCWSLGKPLLINRGLSAKAAGSLTGKMLKELGPVKALGVFDKIQIYGSEDPAAYIQAAIKKHKAEQKLTDKASDFGMFHAGGDDGSIETGGRDLDAGATGEPAVSDVPELFAHSEEETRSMSVGNAAGGDDLGEVSPLRMELRS